MRKKINDAQCKYCESNDIWIESRTSYKAKPVGDYSLSGMMMKFSANEITTYWMVCGGCGHESKGKPADGQSD